MPADQAECLYRARCRCRLRRKCRLEDGWVGLLFHEQRNVLEGVVIVHAESAAEHVIAMTGQIIGEAYARAEAFAVIGCLFSHQ